MKITVYSSPGCPQCNATYRKLDKLDLPFTPVDVTEDPEAHTYVVSLGYTQVPVTVAETDTGEIYHFYGFRPDKLEALARSLSRV